MSRDTLLDEAIVKAKEAEDWQLVEWLRMARGGESAAKWYSEKLRDAHRVERKLLDENAKLRECLQDLAEHIREDDGFGLDYGWMLDRMRELGIEVER